MVKISLLVIYVTEKPEKKNIFCSKKKCLLKFVSLFLFVWANLEVLAEVEVESTTEANLIQDTMTSDNFANVLVSDIKTIDASLSEVGVEVEEVIGNKI